MLCGTRLWRPSAVSLVLVLAVAILAPMVLAPAPAQADVCDIPGVSQACDAGSAAADAVGGLVDAGKAVVKGVKTATTWVGDNAGNVLKAAIAIGLPLATWVACSKVAKVVAAAGAGAAGGAGTGGAGAAPAAVAGAAGAQAVCMVLKKGGKVLLKVGKKAATKGGKLANVAKLAAGAVGLSAIVYGVDHAAAWVLQNLLDLDGASAPNLSAGWLTQLREGLNGMAGLLLLLATILGMTLAGVLGRASDVGRIFTSMISVALIIGVVGSLLLASLRVSDEMTSRTLNSTWGQQALGNWKDLGDSYADATPKKDDEAAASEDASAADDGTPAAPSGTPQDDDKGPWPVRLLIAFFTAIFGALVWLEMQIRDGLLYLLLAFGGLLLAGYPFAATRGIAQRFGMTLLGVVVAKPVIVITLLIGGTMMQSAAAGSTEGGVVVPMLQGVGLMALAALMGSAILAWFSLHGASAMSGLGPRMIAGAGRGFGGSRPGGASGAGGPSESGPDGGGPAGGPDRPDPTRDLARGVGDRVNASGAGMTDAGAMGAAGMAGGATSSRLQAAQDREQQTPQGVAGGAPMGTADGPLTSPAQQDAATLTMPAVGGGGSDPDAHTEGAARPEDREAQRPSVGGGPGPASTAAFAAAGATGAAARPSLGDTDGPGGATPAAVPAAAALGAAQGGAELGGSSSRTSDGVAPASVGAGPPMGAPAAASGPQGALPDVSTESSTAALERPVDSDAPPPDRPTAPMANDAAYAAFGTPAPQDAAAAFGDHAARVRAALDARPEAKA